MNQVPIFPGDGEEIDENMDQPNSEEIGEQSHLVVWQVPNQPPIISA